MEPISLVVVGGVAVAEVQKVLLVIHYGERVDSKLEQMVKTVKIGIYNDEEKKTEEENKTGRRNRKIYG